MSKSMFIYPNGIPERIEFKGGTIGNKFHGQFCTEDENQQKAIEDHPDFGQINTHKIYLSDTIGSDGSAIWGEEVKEEIKSDVPVQEIEKAAVLGFKEIKAILINDYSVSPDDVKNFKQVQKKIKDLNLNYTLQ